MDGYLDVLGAVKGQVEAECVLPPIDAPSHIGYWQWQLPSGKKFSINSAFLCEGRQYAYIYSYV